MENKFYRILFYTSILLIILSFDLQHNPKSGWQEQFLPDIGEREISDIYFLDSLIGWAVTPYTQQNDTSFILKTTNSGFNWFINNIQTGKFVGNKKIIFLNENTGYLCGVDLQKSVNGGQNWFLIHPPNQFLSYDDMVVINEDSIWVCADESLTGGIFLTANGGTTWTRKYYAGGSQNPDKVYFANNMLGFASKGILLRTSDGGNTWNNLNPELGFIDIHFINSFTGWRVAMGAIRKTTDGGLNWVQQTLPATNDTISNIGINEISKLYDNTIYAVGPTAFYFTINKRGLIFKTINGGNNWGYQLPDTSKIRFFKYSHVSFIDTNTGWAYQNVTGGINTNTGGDSTIYTAITNISTEVPKDFRLHQNYPNPFNPKTMIRYDVLKRTKIKLKIFDINGREVIELVNQEHLPGTYEAKFDGGSLSSGIYFGVLNAVNFEDVIRMILIK